MTTLVPIWHNFQDITSDAEAASYAANCIFSLATLEISHPPGSTRFALTEQERPGGWRWAIVDARGQVMDHGLEPTQADAKLASAGALALLGLEASRTRSA